MEEIRTEDVVCLTFDKNKRFIVEKVDPYSSTILVSYFSDYHQKLVSCEIEKRYITKVKDDNEEHQQ